MPLFSRTEVISWDDFFKEKRGEKKWQENFFQINLLGSLMSGVMFATKTGLGDRIATAFQPIIEIAQGICYPISILMITWGLILYGMDNRQAGVQKMKSGIVLYLGIHWLPWLLDILGSVAQSTAPH